MKIKVWRKIVVYFYPRPPRGGRLFFIRKVLKLITISIHALREEGDPQQHEHAAGQQISIHALREEGDLSRLRR